MSSANSAAPSEGRSLNIQKFSSGFNQDMSTVGLAEMHVLLWLGYSLFLFYQYVRQEIKWQTARLIWFLVQLLVCQVIQAFNLPVVSIVTSVLCIMLHWHHIPQATLPVNNKAVLITGKITPVYRKQFNRQGFFVQFSVYNIFMYLQHLICYHVLKCLLLITG